MDTAEAVVYHGNCLEELKNLPDNSIDAIVTDPPYGLGNSDPDYIMSALKMWIEGDREHIPAGKGFMGKQWDAFVPPPAVWDECFRVLKPGGHILVFAGTRTQDLMGLSVRMAGFEIRDSISWIYGSGFPKSLDISKALDKMAGAEREVIGTNGGAPDLRDVGAKSKEAIGIDKLSFGQVSGAERTEILVTAPATDEAKKWTGWGTALKPALEPIIVGRKPLSEKNVSLNVLKWGTGGINIDASRVGTTDNLNGGAYAKNGTARDDGWGMQRAGAGEFEQPQGRFPANLIFTHAEDCVEIGVVEESYTINKTEEWTGFGQKERPDYESTEQKVSTVLYECVDGCPVKELDEQSGIRPGGTYPAKRGQSVNTSFASGQETLGGQRQMGDSGGASRFFYVAKANKKDRNEGLDGLNEKGKVYNGKNDTSAGNAPGSVEDKFTTKPQANHHPTVKPTALMQYLIKMVCPAGGTVLDPFAGSGSTGKAAIREGVNFVGVEMTDEYLPIIKGRLDHEINKKNGSLF
jgi:site-specific DNA-methyltransferase (adenine-specific)